jgi:hypothetical protein
VAHSAQNHDLYRPVHHLSGTAAGKLLVTTSNDAVMLWDMATYYRICTLVGQPPGAIMSHIMPGEEAVVTVFKVLHQLSNLWNATNDCV